MPVSVSLLQVFIGGIPNSFDAPKELPCNFSTLLDNIFYGSDTVTVILPLILPIVAVTVASAPSDACSADY
jgi:hypothetical protein